MAFIDKKDPVVLNIKLTSKGRELLSEGKLDFKYFAIGDSEIDYGFNTVANHNPFYSNILRPADKNPSILSFISRDLSGDTYNTITTVPSTPTIIENNVQSLGFFNISSGSTIFNVDANHVKQPDAMVKIDELSGGTFLSLYKSPTYLANVNEPIIGDFVLVKWANKYNTTSGTTGYGVSSIEPMPYLIYKIQDIASGTLSSNNLVIVVDRELPNFSNITGGTSGITAGVLVYYNYINFTGDTIFSDYSTDYASESVLTFLENCQCPTITYPFWNLSIIYTEELVGVRLDNKKFGNFNSKIYGGFVSYIQNQAPIYKKLGVIHYTNSSPSNTYAEEFYVDIANGKKPTLDLPTIMWHKSTSKTLGLKLQAYGDVKMLTGTTKSLNTNYYDLADTQGNVVGKVFVDLKLFVIEDQELLFAMSYKSNRSWTLPNYSVGVNDNVVVGCPVCTIDFVVDTTSPTTINGSDGTIYIHNIINQIFGSQLVLSVSGATSGQVYFNQITTDAYITGLSADTYFVIIHDLGALNCEGKLITLNNLTSTLAIFDDSTTASGLNPDFNLTVTSPTNIGVTAGNVGTIYGIGYVGIVDYGSIAPVSYALLGTSYNFAPLNFNKPYTIYVKDVYAGTTEFIVSKDYVSVGNPLNQQFTISSQLSDTGGTYVMVSNYLTTINQTINPIVGTIEFSAYLSSSVPLSWKTLPTGDVQGTPMKLYVNGVGTYNIAVRERYQTIEMYQVINPKTII